MSKQVTLSFKNITNNNVPCKDPIIIITGSTGNISFPCGDKIDKDGNIKITISEDQFVGECISGVIKCDECGHCPEQEFTACLCETSADCPACQQCVDGVCIELCKENEKCVDNTCVECENNLDCGPGFICVGGKCVCNGKVNDRGECVDCLTDNHCGPCQTCINGNCEDIVCPNNLICINGGCGCPPGSKYDVASNSCIPADECTTDTDCAECETCVAGNCQPVVCPDGFKCVGGECVPWPCIDTSCNNGADCGPDCGCLNGECVPCYILECTGQCQDALGCKCSASNKCEPVGDCGQYCDGLNPCLDDNCTCYNNRCVSCENFPCIDGEGGCGSYYNCGCNDNGDCEGGNGCSDTLKLNKVENCPTECGLEAIYTTENGCKCDPIVFKVKNLHGTNSGGANDVLDLSIEMFKNGRPYKDFLQELTIGDNEFVKGTFTTQIAFEKKNVNGVWQTESLTSVPAVAATSVNSNNTIDNIKITTGNLGFAMMSKSLLEGNRRATITITAQGVEIPNNECTEYGTKVLTQYVIDFTKNDIYKNRIESFKAERQLELTDNESTRRPLFIFSKSTTGTYLPTKFPETINYNVSGWFTKVYGVKVGNQWKAKITKVAEGVWNNYNYKVSVDCGCKVNNATLNEVIFCCPTEFNYNITQCGRKIEVLPFNTCEQNARLGVTNSVPGQKNILSIGPSEIQTNYYVILNGEDFLLRSGGGNLLTPFIKELQEPITSIVFEQRYEGSPLISVACPVEYTENPGFIDFGVDTECGKITVTKLNNTPNITNVSIQGNNSISFVPSNNNTVWTATVPSDVSANYRVAASFTGGCIFAKDIEVVCEPEVTATPTELVAKGECPEGGVNPNILVKATKGFTSAVKFIDMRFPSVQVNPTSQNPPKVTFNNFNSGTYTFKAVEGTNEAEATVTILAPKQPELKVEPACGFGTGKIKLENGAPGSQWQLIIGSQQVNLTLDNNGFAEFIVPNNLITGPSQSFVINFLNDPSGISCSQQIPGSISKEGGTVSPALVFTDNLICGDGTTFLNINNGLNLTYSVQLTGGTIGGQTTLNLTAGTQYTVAANNTSNILTATITGIVGNDCYTLTSIPSAQITVNQSPIIDIAQECAGGFNKVIVQLRRRDDNTIIIGENASVTILGNFATYFPAGQTFERDFISPPPNPEFTVIVNYLGCTYFAPTESFIDCINNLCPPPGSQIPQTFASPPSPTCIQQNVTLSYLGGVLDAVGATYEWQRLIGGTWITQPSGSGTVGPFVSLSDTGIPNYVVLSESNQKDFRLRILKSNGCEFIGATHEVYVGTGITPSIGGQIDSLITGQSYTYSTVEIPGATYVWTLTPPGGSPQTVGTNSNQVTISLQAGTSILSVAVTTQDGCEGTASIDLVTDLSCPGTVAVGYVGTTGSNQCKNLQATLSGITGTVASWSWEDSLGNILQSGTGAIVNFDASILPAGSTTSIILKVTLSTTCELVSAPFSYTRCSCLCDLSLQCQNVLQLNQGSNEGLLNNLGFFNSGAQIAWAFNPASVADQFLLKLDNVTLIDTGQVTNFSNCGCSGGGNCGCSDLFLGDFIGQSINLALTNGLGNATVSSTPSNNNCPAPNGTTPLSASPELINGLDGTIGGIITLPSSGVLSIEVIGASCGSQYGTAWTGGLKCV